MLVPRMTALQRDAIAAPATGLLIYNTDANLFQFRVGTVWTNLNSEKILVDADGDTKIQVEEGVNDNMIRFDISGDERMVLKENVSGVTILEIIESSNNTLVGEDCGLFTSGVSNTGFGKEALLNNTIGFFNTGVGYRAMRENTSGINNSAFGYGAQESNTTGSYNVAFGPAALRDNTTGSYNTGIGLTTLLNSATSSWNVALGPAAGRDFQHGDFNTFLGTGTQANADGYSNSTAIGYATEITASNQIRVGDAGVTSIGGFQNWTNISDARFKNDVKNDVPGLNFITRLRPVTYTLDRNKIRQTLKQEQVESTVSEPRSTGFLAQEVEEAAKAVGFDFSGVDKPKNEQDFYGLRYAEFTVPLVKAVQELDAENKALKARLDALESMVQKR